MRGKRAGSAGSESEQLTAYMTGLVIMRPRSRRASAWVLPLVRGDRFVLCSDGLYNEVTNDQIAAVLRRLASPADAATMRATRTRGTLLM